MVHAIHIVAKGGAVLDPSVAWRIVEQYQRLLRGKAPVQGLGQHELAALRLLAQGMTTREVASALGMLRQGVMGVIGRVCKKLSVSNKTEAVATALAQGHITLDGSD